MHHWLGGEGAQLPTSLLADVIGVQTLNTATVMLWGFGSNSWLASLHEDKRGRLSGQCAGLLIGGEEIWPGQVYFI